MLRCLGTAKLEHAPSVPHLRFVNSTSNDRLCSVAGRDGRSAPVAPAPVAPDVILM